MNFQLVITCKISRSKAPSWWTPSLNLNLVRWASKGMKPPFSAMAKSHQDFCFEWLHNPSFQRFEHISCFKEVEEPYHKLWWTVFLCILYLDFLILLVNHVWKALRPWEFEAFWRERVSSRDMIHHVRLSVLTHCRQVCFFFIQDYGKCEQTQTSI